MEDQKPKKADSADLDRSSPVDDERGDSPYADSEDHEEEDDSVKRPCPFEKEDHPVWKNCAHLLEETEDSDEEADEGESSEGQGSSKRSSKVRRITCPICQRNFPSKKVMEAPENDLRSFFKVVDPSLDALFQQLEACKSDPTIPLPSIPGTMDKNGLVRLDEATIAKLAFDGYPFAPPNKKSKK